MTSNLFFLFEHRGELYIVDSNHVQDVPKPREQIRRFSQIELIREFAETLGKPIAMDTARERTRKHTEDGRRRIAEAKMGDNHPSRIHGVADETKKKISETIKRKGIRKGENNPFWGQQHTTETKRKQAAYQRSIIGKLRWASHPELPARKLPRDEPLPEGWQWGRFYDKYR